MLACVFMFIAADPAVLLLVNGAKGPAKAAHVDAAKVLRANSRTVRDVDGLGAKQKKLAAKCKGEDACVRAIAKPAGVDAAFVVIVSPGSLRMVWYDVAHDAFDESRVGLNKKTKLHEVLSDFVKAHAQTLPPAIALVPTPPPAAPTSAAQSVAPGTPAAAPLPATQTPPSPAPAPPPSPSPTLAAPAATTPRVATKPAQSGIGTLTITGLILGGVGIAVLGAGAGFGAASQTEKQKVVYGAGGTSQIAAKQHVQRSNDFALIANIGLIAGGAIAATGVALIIVDLMKPKDDALVFAPMPLSDGVGGVVHARF